MSEEKRETEYKEIVNIVYLQKFYKILLLFIEREVKLGPRCNDPLKEEILLEIQQLRKILGDPK